MKKVFFEIWQNSRENTHAKSLLGKVAGLKTDLYKHLFCRTSANDSS